MEYCEGSLPLLVRESQNDLRLPGLPPVDTVVLGMMLVDAVAAVHRRARALHLDIKPDNILLSRIACKPGNDTATHRSVKLGDFGLCRRLPTCVASTLPTGQRSLAPGAVGHSPMYAPLEQLEGNARRASDIYGIGATLKYAATGQHPFSPANDASMVLLSLMKGATLHLEGNAALGGCE
jgi:eukaryotic-like serine/threonine-protein kinase